MSASTLEVGAESTFRRPALPPVVVLGWREARRMVLSPVFAIFGAMVMLNGVGVAFDTFPSRSDFYEAILYFVALYLGLISYITAHLVSSSARRTGAERQCEAATLSTRQRGAGLSLGVVFGPGLLAAALVAILGLLGNAAAGANNGAPMSGVELVQLTLIVVGGGMFGLMWATWLRFPGSLPLGLVVLIVFTASMNSPAREPLNTWPWFAPYIASPGFFDGEAWPLLGSQGWHAAYLLGLCGMAFCATMLRPKDQRGRWLVVTGVVVAATAVVGLLQI